MDLLYIFALLACVYFIVYCRLTLREFERGTTPHVGIGLVLSLPLRAGLAPGGLRYWRLYWAGWAAVLALLALGAWWRHEHIGAALSGG